MSKAFDPPHFKHIDRDGDKFEVIATELGSLVRAKGTEGDYVEIALRYKDIPKLIETLTAILENE